MNLEPQISTELTLGKLTQFILNTTDVILSIYPSTSKMNAKTLTALLLIITLSQTDQHELSSPETLQPTKSQSSIHPLLIFTTRSEIRSIDISNLTSKPEITFTDDLPPYTINPPVRAQAGNSKPFRTLIPGLKNAIGLDFYYSDNSESYIYWSDVVEERIYRGTVSAGSIVNHEVMLHNGLAAAEGLAVDWVGKNIYWVESTLDHIEVASMNGSFRRTLIAGDMDSPRAIALDPRFGLLFWTDWDKKSPRIERSTMSGEDRKVLVHIRDINGGWPNGITLDYTNFRIYWIDANSNSIHAVNYDGTSHQLILKHAQSLGHPFSITLFDENLFWTDWKNNSVSMASKFDGTGVREVQKLPNRLFDIKVFHPSRQPRVDPKNNPCAINNGGCSHLCLLTSKGARRCECPNLTKLSQDGMICEIDEHVLLIGRTNEIRAVDIDEPLRHVMAPISVPKVFSPKQFEYYSKTKSIFWADSQTNEVKRSELLGNNIDTIIDVIIESPSGLALDWISGNIYVTSALQSKTGKIYISNLNGEYISLLMDSSHMIRSPKSIAVHPVLGILFCIDEDIDTEPIIFMSGMDGSNKQVITSKSLNPSLGNPTSLAIDYELNRVYWVNQAINTSSDASIQYYDIYDKRVVTVLDEKDLPLGERINPGALCVDGEYLYIGGRIPKEFIFKFQRNDLTNKTILKTQNLDQLSALRVYNAQLQKGTNACSYNNGNCSQLCVPSNSTHRSCRCVIGYTISPENENACVGKESFLIFSYNLGMGGISLEPGSSPGDSYLPPIHKAFRASSIDYVYRHNTIFWVDNEEGSITRINRDTTGYQVIVQSLESEESIAVDYVACNVYWLDPYYDVIEVARLNGSSRYVIISGDMEKANNIVVDPINGRIAWSDVGSLPKIESAMLNGSDRRIVVNSNLTHVDDLVFDKSNPGFLYWVDSSVVSRVFWDGTQRSVVFQPNQRQHNLTLIASIAIHGEYLYMADSVLNQGSIVRCSKLTGSNYQIIQQNLGEGIRDIAVFAPQTLPSADLNPCVENNGGCQDLCLFSGKPGKRKCICSHGELNSDEMTCKPYSTFVLYSKFTQIDTLHVKDDDSLINNSPYAPISENRSTIVSIAVDYSAQRVIYSEMGYHDSICSIYFNGSDRRVLMEKQSFVEGVAFSNNELYWTNGNDHSISRLNISSSGTLGKHCDLDGSCTSARVEKIIQLSNEDKPRGITIDPCTSYIYWTNWNVNASIQRASPQNKFKVESIIKTDIMIPNGIAIDQKMRRLYWCDAKLDKIESCEMDGSSRVVLMLLARQHPFALVVWENYIFWTDWLARGVFRADKYTGADQIQIKKLTQRPMGIAVATPDTYDCPFDPCTIDNGGCQPDQSCHMQEDISGLVTVRCKPKGVDHEVVIPRSMRCKHPKSGRSCIASNNYHDIIKDASGRYDLTDTFTHTLEPRDYQVGAPSTLPTTEPIFPLKVPTFSQSPKNIDFDITHITPNSTHSPTPTKQEGSAIIHKNWDSTTIVDRIPYNTTLTSISGSRHGPFTSGELVSTHATTTTNSQVNSTLVITRNTSPLSIPESTSIKPQNQDLVGSSPSVEQSSQATTAVASVSTNQANVYNTTQNSVITTVPYDTSIPCLGTARLTQSSITTEPNIPPSECKFLQFACFSSENSICIGQEKRCDGNVDCPGGEDEVACYKRSPIYKRDLGMLLIIVGIVLIAIALMMHPQINFLIMSRRRFWFSPKGPFSHRRMFDDTGTNIEISNPMFDEDDRGNLSHCPFSIDLSERTTNFSNPLYERQVLLMGDKNVNRA